MVDNGKQIEIDERQSWCVASGHDGRCESLRRVSRWRVQIYIGDSIVESEPNVLG